MLVPSRVAGECLTTSPRGGEGAGRAWLRHSRGGWCKYLYRADCRPPTGCPTGWSWAETHTVALRGLGRWAPCPRAPGPCRLAGSEIPSPPDILPHTPAPCHHEGTREPITSVMSSIQVALGRVSRLLTLRAEQSRCLVFSSGK